MKLSDVRDIVGEVGRDAEWGKVANTAEAIQGSNRSPAK